MKPTNPAAGEAARFGSGRDVRRVEDEKLVSGHGRYADDLAPDGQHHLCFQRSPYAHARIVSIDTDAARGMPGVAAVYTGAELVAAGVKPLPTSADFKRADGAVCASPLRQPLAHERVRFVGEAVVAVVADTPQHAKDAAEAVAIEYEELPFVVNLAQATAPGAPVVCDAAPRQHRRREIAR